MSHGRRLAGLFVVTILAFPLVGLNLFGEDKKEDAKKAATKKDETKKKDEAKKAESKSSGKVTLAWKLDKGTSFYQTMTTDTKQTMKVMNNDVTQNQKQIFYFEWKVLDNKDGKVTLEQKILGVKMDIDIGGSPIKYDSTNPSANNTSNPLSDFFKALVGATFKMDLDTKKLKITKIEGRDEFVNKLVAANKQMKPLLDKILSENALKEMAEPTFAVVSNDPIEKGKTWKKETKLDMGPIGTYTNEYTYTYDGTEEASKLDKIDVATKLIYAPPAKTDGIGGLPFKIKDAKLDSKNSKGTIYFNREKGRVAKSEMSLELAGNLQIEIAGQPTKVELSQTQTTKVETSDTNPVEPKPNGDKKKE